jgi:Tol biopolymer transport system component
MTRTTLAVLVAIVLVSAAPGAQDAERLFKAAMNAELVEGNLRAAIEQYRTVAEGAPRPLAARALLRMAESYQKLGDAEEARKIYERLTRDYADQREAVAVARTRLRRDTTTASSRGDRAVWTGVNVDGFGTISPDGRVLTYTDWARTNNLMLRDLQSDTSQSLTNNTMWGELGYSNYSVISRDGQQVVFNWQPRDTGRQELRLMSLQRPGLSASSRLFENQGKDFVRPFDWSPDGKRIAVLVEREDQASQIGFVDVPGGALRVLKSIEWRGTDRIVFSPDGRYIAYALASSEFPGQEHVFVMAIDGTRETAVDVDPSRNQVMGWSPDGTLLFASDRSGSTALWALLIEDGKPRARPRLVKADIGTSMSLGLTRAGALYVWKRASMPNVVVARIDLQSDKPLDMSGPVFHRFVESRGRPQWSSDGKQLLYVSCASSGAGPCKLFVRSMDSGNVREILHTLRYVGFPRFSPDGRSIVTDGTDAKGRRGVHLIDLQTGRTAEIMRFEVGSIRRVLGWSADGSGVLLQVDSPSQVTVVRRDVQSGNETEILRTALVVETPIGISPDGRFAGFLAKESGVNRSLVALPIGGGAPKELFRVGSGSEINWQWQWLPDGRGVIVIAGSTASDSARAEIWVVPMEGQPRRLNIDMSSWEEGGHLRLSPDGRHAAFVSAAGKPGSEVWALENFLPALK